MSLRVVRLLNLVFVMADFGLVFAHALEIPGKLRFTGVQWLTVQQNLYIGAEVLAVTGPAPPLNSADGRAEINCRRRTATCSAPPLFISPVRDESGSVCSILPRS